MSYFEKDKNFKSNEISKCPILKKTKTFNQTKYRNALF